MDVTVATPAQIDIEIARLDGERAEIARQIELLKARMAKVAEQARPLHAEYARRPWTRIYRVDNPNGHVHISPACSTTYATTGFHWFPELSGKGAAEIVDMAGEYTCLVCFGQVRSEILEARKGRPCRIETPGQVKTREEREAAAAVKAAKVTARNAKALVRPIKINGSIFEVTTKADAWSHLTDALIDVYDWSTPEHGSHLSEVQRAANLRNAQQDVETLRAVLVESFPELTGDDFQAMEARKVKAKKQRHNRELRGAGFPARY